MRVVVPSSRRRGMTILEMLASVVLTVLVFTIAYQVLLPATRVWALNQAQANLEESSLVAETKLTREMMRSSRASMTVTVPGPNTLPSNSSVQAVSFTSAGDQVTDDFNAATAKPVWQYFVVYFVPANTTNLYRKVWPNPSLPAGASQQPPIGWGGGGVPYAFPNSNPVPLASDDLQYICNTSNGTEVLLSKNVTQFTVSAALSSNATILIDFQAISPTGQLVQTERTTQIQFRM